MHSSPKCHSTSIMLRLHDPLWAKLMAARLFLEYFGIQINSWSRACKISPSHHPSSAVLDNRYELFVLICCVLISPDIVLSIMVKHLYFILICPKDIVPEIWLFVQIWFYKPVLCWDVLFWEKRLLFVTPLSNTLNRSLVCCRRRQKAICTYICSYGQCRVTS